MYTILNYVMIIIYILSGVFLMYYKTNEMFLIVSCVIIIGFAHLKVSSSSSQNYSTQLKKCDVINKHKPIKYALYAFGPLDVENVSDNTISFRTHHKIKSEYIIIQNRLLKILARNLNTLTYSVPHIGTMPIALTNNTSLSIANNDKVFIIGFDTR